MPEIEAARRTLRRFLAAYPVAAPPVDVEELAGSVLRLLVRHRGDLGAVAGAPPGTPLSGLLLADRYEIWVNEAETPVRRRFSIAHEIGHFMLHVPAERRLFCRPVEIGADPDPVEKAREREANRFAAELLMPEDLVRAAVEALGAPDPFALAARFGVSDIAMGYRLVNLGYLAELPLPLEEERQRWRGVGPGTSPGP